MYRHCALPRRNGKASLEGFWRFGQGYIHGRRNCYIQRITLLIPLQEYDLRNTASLEESVRHSDAVYNLVGRMYPTKYVRVIEVEEKY